MIVLDFLRGREMPFEEVTIGPCRLIRGDCLEVLPTLGIVDAVVTDPPYGIGLRNGDVDGHRSQREFEIVGDKDQSAGLRIIEWADELEKPIIAFASPWKPWPGKWQNLIAWDKGGAVGGGGDIKTCLKRTWELIQVDTRRVMKGPRIGSVWSFPMIPSDTADHIAAKPIELMRALIERFIGISNDIFDPFMGSGSTGIAALQTGHDFIGIEIEPRYFDIACRRIEEAWGKGSLFDDERKPEAELFSEDL